MNGLLKFITCGSVDDGKSTLIGHILYDSKLLYADQEKALVLDSRVGQRGGEIDYSLLLDGLMAEREQGITIDVAYRYFTTENRSFIVADAPGHEEYTRNMAVGASFAQLAVILVDARRGVLVQTRRHCRICRLMGINHFVFAVNKMDLVGYGEERFSDISKDIDGLSSSLGLKDVKIIPVSATEGDNVTKKSDNMKWWPGEPLLAYLENVDVSEKDVKTNFYMPVQRVCRPNQEFRGFQGQIESGGARVGQSVSIVPGSETANIKSIFVGDKETDEAAAGQGVTIVLDREVDVSRGCVIADKSCPPPLAREFSATILWMDDDRLTAGREYLIKLATKKIPGIIKKIEYKVDVNTGEHLDADYIEKNEIALCRVGLAENVAVDEFDGDRTLSEFILIDRVTHMTSACGVVESLKDEEEKPYFEKDGIKIKGYIFEEFYFNPESATLAKQSARGGTYHVGDEVPVQGDSFKYPDFFDIISAASGAAVLIRNKKIADIIPISDYEYMGLPMLDEKGFALEVSMQEDLDEFLKEYGEANEDGKMDVHNKWTRFETYRMIVCTNNFWTI